MSLNLNLSTADKTIGRRQYSLAKPVPKLVGVHHNPKGSHYHI